MGAITAYIIVMRIHTFARIYVNEDEIYYWTIAQDIVKGGIPYVTMWDHKGPVLFYLLAIPAYFFPVSFTAQHVFTALAVIWTGGWTVAACRQYTGWLASAAAFFALAWMTSWQRALAGNAEIYCMVFQAPAFYCMFRWRQQSSRKSYLWMAGACITAILLCKVNAVFCMAAFPLLLWRGSLRAFCVDALHLLLGILVPMLLALAYFAWLGNLHLFLLSYINWNLLYSSSTMASDSAAQMLGVFTDTLRWPSMAACAALLVLGVRYRHLPPRLRFFLQVTLLSLLGALIAVFIPRHNMLHYFIHLFPALCFLTALFVEALPAWRNSELWGGSGLLVVVIALILSALPGQLKYYQDLKKDLPNSPRIQASQYLADHTTPDTPILVMGNSSLYYLSGRHAPTAILFNLHNKGGRAHYFHELGMQTSVDMLPVKPPAYIEVESPDLPEADFAPNAEFVRENYRLEMQFRNIYLWHYTKALGADGQPAPTPHQ